MYGKIFSSMYDGTLADNWEALVTFQQLIVLANADGVVDMTPSAIARRTGIPSEIINKGLEHLGKPDDDSRSPEMDGRRIMLLDAHRDWGWMIVNYERYRDLSNSAKKRELDAARKREARRRSKDSEPKTAPDTTGQERTEPDASANVRKPPQKSAHIDIDTDTDTDTPSHTKESEKSKHWESSEFREVWGKWRDYQRGQRGKPLDEWSELEQLHSIEHFETADAIKLIRFSVARGARNLITNGDHQKRDGPSGGKRHRTNNHDLERDILKASDWDE